jgi:hypothetical protein
MNVKKYEFLFMTLQTAHYENLLIVSNRTASDSCYTTHLALHNTSVAQNVIQCCTDEFLQGNIINTFPDLRP